MPKTMFQVKCPECGKRFERPVHLKGATVRCPGCAVRLRIGTDGPKVKGYALADPRDVKTYFSEMKQHKVPMRTRMQWLSRVFGGRGGYTSEQLYEIVTGKKKDAYFIYPFVKNAPPEVNRILEAAYRRHRRQGDSKAAAAIAAWTKVKQAGYVRVTKPTRSWVKGRTMKKYQKTLMKAGMPLDKRLARKALKHWPWLAAAAAVPSIAREFQKRHKAAQMERAQANYAEQYVAWPAIARSASVLGRRLIGKGGRKLLRRGVRRGRTIGRGLRKSLKVPAVGGAAAGFPREGGFLRHAAGLAGATARGGARFTRAHPRITQSIGVGGTAYIVGKRKGRREPRRGYAWGSLREQLSRKPKKLPFRVRAKGLGGRVLRGAGKGAKIAGVAAALGAGAEVMRQAMNEIMERGTRKVGPYAPKIRPDIELGYGYTSGDVLYYAYRIPNPDVTRLKRWLGQKAHLARGATQRGMLWFLAGYLAAELMARGLTTPKSKHKVELTGGGQPIGYPPMAYPPKSYQLRASQVSPRDMEGMRIVNPETAASMRGGPRQRAQRIRTQVKASKRRLYPMKLGKLSKVGIAATPWLAWGALRQERYAFGIGGVLKVGKKLVGRHTRKRILKKAAIRGKGIGSFLRRKKRLPLTRLEKAGQVANIAFPGLIAADIALQLKKPKPQPIQTQAYGLKQWRQGRYLRKVRSGLFRAWDEGQITTKEVVDTCVRLGIPIPRRIQWYVKSEAKIHKKVGLKQSIPEAAQRRIAKRFSPKVRVASNIGHGYSRLDYASPATCTPKEPEPLPPGLYFCPECRGALIRWNTPVPEFKTNCPKCSVKMKRVSVFSHLGGVEKYPFKSAAQRKWMHMKHPEMAKRWEKETPKGKKLPEHVSKCSLCYSAGLWRRLRKKDLRAKIMRVLQRVREMPPEHAIPIGVVAGGVGGAAVAKRRVKKRVIEALGD